MKGILIFFTLLISTKALSDYEEWQNYKSIFNKQYQDLKEEITGYTNFKKNLATIKENNAKFQKGEVSYKLDINKFTDQTFGESPHFATAKNSNNLNLFPETTNFNYNLFSTDCNNVTEEMDWRKFGVDNPVFDETDFYNGFGWAFATIDAVASTYLINNNLEVNPSAQQLIDCIEFESGVFDGSVDLNTIFRYVLNNKIATEESYGYIGQKGACNEKIEGELGPDFLIELTNDEGYLKNSVGSSDCGGPVLTTVDATNFLNYKSGIITEDLCEENLNLNQAVLVVGYGSEDDTDFWIVKNSWGTDWGEDGYFRITRDRNFTCGIGKVGKLLYKFKNN